MPAFRSLLLYRQKRHKQTDNIHLDKVRMKLPLQFIQTKKLDSLHGRVHTLSANIEQATAFIREIESGNMEARFEREEELTKESTLAKVLVSMRDQMKTLSEKEQQRIWVTEGLARFSEMLRANQHDVDQLSQQIISGVVKYVGATQGALYLVNKEDGKTWLDMAACFAYDRKKYINKRLEPGEGLVGQVFLEKETMYLKHVPKDFIAITSGLGEALPTEVAIVPLKISEEVHGLLELASFYEFQPHHLEFLERVGESIASTVSNVRINQITRALLAESQIKTEELRSQEEEMRQSFEELQATQEEMHRRKEEAEQMNRRLAENEEQLKQALQEARQKEQIILDQQAALQSQFVALASSKEASEQQRAYTESLLNSTDDIILICNLQAVVQMANKAAHELFRAKGMTIGQHTSLLDMTSSAAEREQVAQRLELVRKGENLHFERPFSYNGIEGYYDFNYVCIRSQEGQATGIGLFARDITIRKQQEEELKRRTEELAASEEELRQSVEELQTIQEEISRKKAQIESLVNSSLDNIFVIDQQYRLTLFNENTRKVYEAGGVEVVEGAPIFNYIAPEEQEGYRQLFQAVLAGAVIQQEVAYSFEGIQGVYDLRCFPVRPQTGEIIGIGVITRDITEKKQAEQELLKSKELLKENETQMQHYIHELEAIQQVLAASEKRLLRLLDHTPHGIFVLDAQGKPFYANEAAKALLGQGITSEEGSLAQVYKAVLSGTDIEYPVSNMPIVQALGGKIAHADDMEIIRPDARVQIEVTASPVFDPSGAVEYAVAVFQDITQRRKLHAELVTKDMTLSALKDQMKEYEAELKEKEYEIEKLRQTVAELKMGVVTHHHHNGKSR